ncbi:hypothetical protein [Methylobacterium nigriterrae]|uniref:hypothetical protein n=1 Tax=Methylobacterium nigriterrae TaxID=3127512 RepID=UPI0030132293
MPPRLVMLFVAVLLTTDAIAAGASVEDDCPKHFREYGLFLQAKKSCGREDEYPSMKLMRACAKQTPKQSALTLMDEGRREWARSVMRASLGNRCAQVFREQSPASEKRKPR